MNKIKTVKIKNEDGSISDESYSLTTDAINIDMANGKDLQETIGDINVDRDGNIAEQLKHKIDTIYIEDNLNSTDINKALSANQGRILNDKINKKPYYYNNIDDMKADVNLKAGDMAVTFGYYQENDGGGAEYKIIDDNFLINNNDSIINLVNGLKAKLVIKEYITPEMFGAYGDNIHDDGLALKKCGEIGGNIIFAPKKIYLSSEDIILNNAGKINLNGSTIKMYNRLNNQTAHIFNIKSNGIIIENGFLVGDLDSRETYPETVHGIRIGGAENIEIKNLKISKFCADGITITNSKNINIHNIEVNNCGRNNISLLYGENISLYNIYTHHCEGKKTPGHGIDVEPYANNQNIIGLNIHDIYTKNNYGSGINLSFYYDGEVNANVNNIYCKDPFTIKSSNISVGNIVVNNVFIQNASMSLQDIASENFFVNIENVTIKDYNPTTTSSFWGAAIKIRCGVNYGTNLYNLLFNKIIIEDGTPTQGIYVGTTGNVQNSYISDIHCLINTIPVLNGSNVDGLIIKNIYSDYIPTATSINANKIAPVIDIIGAATVSRNYPYKDWIELRNNTDSDITINSEEVNNYGLSYFILSAKTKCKIKVNDDGTIIVDSKRVIFNTLANSSITINADNATKITCKRSSYYDVYDIYGNELLQIFTVGTSNIATSISNYIITVINNSGGAGKIFLDN